MAFCLNIEALIMTYGVLGELCWTISSVILSANMVAGEDNRDATAFVLRNDRASLGPELRLRNARLMGAR